MECGGHGRGDGPLELDTDSRVTVFRLGMDLDNAEAELKAARCLDTAAVDAGVAWTDYFVFAPRV